MVLGLRVAARRATAEVEVAGEAERGGDQVADAGQDGGGVAGAGPAGVFSVGHVADPVDVVLG